MRVLVAIVLGLLLSGAEAQCDTASAAMGTKVIGIAAVADLDFNLLNDCYSGLDPTNFENCFAVPECYPDCDDDTVYNWNYEETDAYNCAMDPYSEMPICLHCCSDTKHTEPGEEIIETWKTVCPVQTNMQRSLLKSQHYKSHEFRFLVQSPDSPDSGKDYAVCTIGRAGCDYMWDPHDDKQFDPGDEYLPGGSRPLSCRSGHDDGDGTVGAERDDYGACNQTADGVELCYCDIPGSQSIGKFNRPRVREFIDSACASNNYYLTEIELSLDVMLFADIFGNTWRSVSACSVRTKESSMLSLNDNLLQNVIMRVVDGPNPWLTYAWPCLALVILAFFVCISCLIRWRRDKVCATCTRRLIFGRDQCLICQWLGVQPPDIVLLSRLRDRGQRVIGPGHYYRSGFRYVPEAPQKVKEMHTKYVQPVQQRTISAVNDLTVVYASVQQKTSAPAARIARAWRRVRGLPPRSVNPTRVHVLDQSKFDQVANQFGSVSETWKERSRSKRIMEQNTRVPNRRELQIRDYEKARAQNSVRTAPVGSKH